MVSLRYENFTSQKIFFSCRLRDRFANTFAFNVVAWHSDFPKLI